MSQYGVIPPELPGKKEQHDDARREEKFSECSYQAKAAGGSLAFRG